MNYKPVNFSEKFSLFSETWSPKLIAELNDSYQFKLVKIKGEFVWHEHADTDEAFIVLDGNMVIEFRDGVLELQTGEMYIVPKGVEHRPFAKDLCRILVIEPRNVVNTGTAGGELTAENDVWI